MKKVIKNDNNNVYITTNQQPWVEALACGLITVKTRTSFLHVPKGAIVLLHTSKAKLWTGWKELFWTKNLDPKKWERGKVVAIAEVEDVGSTDEILKKEEYKYWKLNDGWNCAAEHAVRFKNIKRLTNPVECTGYQAPYCRASQEIIDKVIKNNPDTKSILLSPSLQENI